MPGGGGDPDYVVSFGQSQYLLYDLVGALLTRALGDAVVANRVLLAAIALVWPFAFRALLRAIGRDERLALFAPMLFWSRALTIGFLPFVGSVPLALVALAVLIRQLESPTKKGMAVLGGLAVLLFYAHVSTYVLFGAAGGLFALARLGKDVKRIARVFAPLGPSLVCAVVWWRAGTLGQVAGQRDRVTRISAGTALDAAPIWAFDLWKSHQDELWAVLWWLAFTVIAVDGLRTKPDSSTLKRGAFALIPLVCTAVIYLVTPFHVGPAGYLDVRLAPLLALFSVMLLRPVTARLARVAFALSAVAAIGTAATATYEMRRIERDMLGDFDAMLAAIPANSRLATLNFETRSPNAYFWPYVFVGAYHRLKPGTVSAYSFTELAHWPIHYAPGHAPPKHIEFWTYHPCETHYRSDGQYYDYVLVQGHYDPWALEHPGPTFKRIARSGAFSLYAKDESVLDASPDAPDRTVCRRRPRPDAPYDVKP